MNKSLQHEERVKDEHISRPFVCWSTESFFWHTHTLTHSLPLCGQAEGVLSDYRKSGLASLGKRDKSRQSVSECVCAHLCMSLCGFSRRQSHLHSVQNWFANNKHTYRHTTKPSQTNQFCTVCFGFSVCTVGVLLLLCKWYWPFPLLVANSNSLCVVC